MLPGNVSVLLYTLDLTEKKYQMLCLDCGTISCKNLDCDKSRLLRVGSGEECSRSVRKRVTNEKVKEEMYNWKLENKQNDVAATWQEV